LPAGRGSGLRAGHGSGRAACRHDASAGHGASGIRRRAARSQWLDPAAGRGLDGSAAAASAGSSGPVAGRSDRAAAERSGREYSERSRGAVAAGSEYADQFGAEDVGSERGRTAGAAVPERSAAAHAGRSAADAAGLRTAVIAADFAGPRWLGDAGFDHALKQRFPINRAAAVRDESLAVAARLCPDASRSDSGEGPLRDNSPVAVWQGEAGGGFGGWSASRRPGT